LLNADLIELEDDLVEVAGLPGVTSRPPDSVLFSRGVRTNFGRPEKSPRTVGPEPRARNEPFRSRCRP